MVDAARAIGLPVGGELDLFAKALAALAQQHGYAPKVLAITGTNGKTTVTALTGHLLEHAGWSAAVAGNIGPSLLDTLTHHLDAENLPRPGCWSCPAFSLRACKISRPVRPWCSTLRKTTWTGTAAWPLTPPPKHRVFGAQGCMVLNRQDEAVMAMLPAPVELKGRQAAAALAHHLWQQPAAAAGRLWPGRSQWHALAGARARRGRARWQPVSAAPAAGRCAAHSRPAQRLQRPGRLGPGPGSGLPAGTALVWPARIPGRAAPGAVPGAGRWHRVFRR